MPGAFVLRCSQAVFLRFVVCEPRSVLGRSSGCDFVLDEQSVSRRHAEIRLAKGMLHVTDLRSANGTFIDDLRVVNGEAAPGQLLRFGTVEFAVAIEDLDSIVAASEEETDSKVPASGGKGRYLQALSDAQRRVFDLLVSGFPEKSISKRLNLSSHTVHSHTKMIFKTFGVHSRAQLLAHLLKPSSKPGGPIPAKPPPLRD